MVHQLAANRQIGDDGNAQHTHVIRWADARAQQNGGTAVDPCRQDGGRRALNAAVDEMHPPGVAAFDDHPIDLDLTPDCQIRTAATSSVRYTMPVFCRTPSATFSGYGPIPFCAAALKSSMR